MATGCRYRPKSHVKQRDPYNQFFRYRATRAAASIASKGFQAFLPLSPWLALMLYDSAVYSVGRQGADVVFVTAPRDVDQLNILQLAAALENVYLAAATPDVERVFALAKQHRRELRPTFHTVVEREDARHRSELVGFQVPDLRTDLELSFVRVTRAAKEWLREFRAMPRQPVLVPRDPALLQASRDFRDSVRKGAYQPDDFEHFYASWRAARGLP